MAMNAMQDQAASLRRLAAQRQRAPSFAFIGSEHAGTSTVVTELSLGLAYAGLRPIVVDCCLGQVQTRRLGVPATATLESQVVSVGGLDEMMVGSRQGVQLINLYAQPEQRALFSTQLWLRLGSEFGAQERDASALLIDAPDPVRDPIPASVADNLVLVLTPDADSLTAAYANIKRLASRFGRQRFNVLINRARHLEEAHELFTRLSAVASEFLTVSLRWVGFVPHDNAVRRSQTLRRPLMEAFPDSEAAAAFSQLSAVLPQWDAPETSRDSTGYMDLLIAASRDWAEADGAKPL
ncbi:MinD/ParA family ATP-binding protein [Chromobacterium violaceum]|uniref:Flagellar synthesis regulator FleN n=1 Tax=Chromobacterium violaceum (strain ATCC 12472 / DSM 30191 / JCM 1249 / CCUG 213 / NBRC 12614 / NCIMB 9131 / NCTC 9757 / MK) TaxID=243365 RepID=Q7NZ99_CHRVO|nr:flagellar synthesis regulator FleN [Chromobacterium violaceum]AAQ58698.1 flagellar synthesis regulator FleN [Chromobacterium violaceum ATCC 12472]